MTLTDHPNHAALAMAARVALTAGDVWAIHPRALDVIRAAAICAPPASQATVPEPTARGPRGLTVTRGGVAIVSLRGVLTPRGSLLALLFGVPGGVNTFRAELAEALADDEVSAILIDVDSPGGVVSTIPETAAEIRAARGVKPIVAIANTMCASAALWLAAQADELVITPSGVAGSVGALMVHEDWSRYNEEAGVTPTYVAAGRYKAEGNPDEPLGDEARAEWQAWVDDVYAMFVADLAAGRSVTAAHVGERFGEGRVLRPTAAVAAKMCDRVATIDDTIAALSAPSRRPRAPRAVEEAPAPAALPVGDDPERVLASGEPEPAVEEPAVEKHSEAGDDPADDRQRDPAAARMAAMRAFRA